MRFVIKLCLLVFLSATALADPLALWEAAKRNDWDTFERIASEMRQKYETCSVLFRPTEDADSLYALIRNDNALSDTQKRLLISLCPLTSKHILQGAQGPKRVSELLDLLSTTTRRESPENETLRRPFRLSGTGYETRAQKFRATVRAFAAASSCIGTSYSSVPSCEFEDLAPRQVSEKLTRLSEIEIAHRGPSEYANNLKRLSEICDGIVAWHLFPTISFSPIVVPALPLWEVRAMMSNQHFWLKMANDKDRGIRTLAALILRFMSAEPAGSLLFQIAKLQPRAVIDAVRTDARLVPFLQTMNPREQTLLFELAQSTPLALLTLLREHPTLMLENNGALRLTLDMMWTLTWEGRFENNVACVPHLLSIRNNKGQWPLIALVRRDPAAFLDLIRCFANDATFFEALAKCDDDTGGTALHTFARSADTAALVELQALIIAHNNLATAMTVENNAGETPLQYFAQRESEAKLMSLIDLLRLQLALLPALSARTIESIWYRLPSLAAEELIKYLDGKSEEQLDEMMPFIEKLFDSGLQPDFNFLRCLIIDKNKVPKRMRSQLISLLAKNPLELLYGGSRIHVLCRCYPFIVLDGLQEAPALVQIVGQDIRDSTGDGPLVAVFRKIAIESDRPDLFLNMVASFAELAEKSPKQFARFFSAGIFEQEPGDTLLHAMARTKGRAMLMHLIHFSNCFDAAVKLLSLKNQKGTSALSLMLADWPQLENPRLLVPFLKSGADPYLEFEGHRLIDWIMTSPDLTDEQRRELLYASAVGQSGRPEQLAVELERERAVSRVQPFNWQAAILMFALTAFAVSRLH